MRRVLTTSLAAALLAAVAVGGPPAPTRGGVPVVPAADEDWRRFVSLRPCATIDDVRIEGAAVEVLVTGHRGMSSVWCEGRKIDLGIALEGRVPVVAPASPGPVVIAADGAAPMGVVRRVLAACADSASRIAKTVVALGDHGLTGLAPDAPGGAAAVRVELPLPLSDEQLKSLAATAQPGIPVVLAVPDDAPFADFVRAVDALRTAGAAGIRIASVR
jgi:hypothetical protein